MPLPICLTSMAEISAVAAEAPQKRSMFGTCLNACCSDSPATVFTTKLEAKHQQGFLDGRHLLAKREEGRIGYLDHAGRQAHIMAEQLGQVE